MDGALSMIGPEGEGRMIVKYSALPIPYDTEYVVLGTDYDNYAVLWSCSGIGPVHTRKLMLYGTVYDFCIRNFATRTLKTHLCVTLSPL